MHLVYMDDSGDPAVGIFSALAIPAETWATAFAAMKHFRKSIADSDGIQLYKELHAWKFVSGRGRFKKHVSVARRCEIFNEALKVAVGMQGATLFNAIFPQTTKKEGWGFERMLNRIQRNMVEKNSHALIIVTTMGLKPSPSGESFRFYDSLELEEWRTTERVLIVGLTSSTTLCG